MDSMIEKLKKNLAMFRAMPEDEQAALNQIKANNPSDVKYLCDDGTWQSPVANGLCRWNDRYRIAPDYEPEPETIEREVFTREGRLYYSICPDDSGWTIECALNNPDFIGYKYADGDVRCSPRRSNDPDRPAEIPTHVLFRRSK